MSSLFRQRDDDSRQAVCAGRSRQERTRRPGECLRRQTVVSTNLTGIKKARSIQPGSSRQIARNGVGHRFHPHSPTRPTRRCLPILRQADTKLGADWSGNLFGRLTQRLECHLHTVEVTGSNPVSPIFRTTVVPLAMVVLMVERSISVGRFRSRRFWASSCR